MDAFFASVEQLTRPTLRGRPVLVGGTGLRGVVAGASYEARVFGARSAMPMHQARRMVGPQAVVLPPRGAVYSAMSGAVFDVVRERLPVLEQLSVDEAFGEPTELAGADAVTVWRFCEDLRTAVHERTGLVASLGAGSGKQIAKIASGLAKPNGVRVVSPAEQHELLAALPVRKLWGIGPVGEEKLRKLGVERWVHSRRCRNRRWRRSSAARSARRCIASRGASTTVPSPSARRRNRSVPRPRCRPTS